MPITVPKLNTDTLINGGTVADAQKHFIRLNGSLLGEVGMEYPYEKATVLAERVERILEIDYGISLKRDSRRALTEVIKVGQGKEKQRIARLSFRASGRKSPAAKVKSKASAPPQPEVTDMAQSIPAANSPIESAPQLSTSLPAQTVRQDRPKIGTFVAREIAGDHPLRSVLMAYVRKGELSDLPELKRLLAQAPSNWRSEQIPDDCRAALEWVDAQ